MDTDRARECAEQLLAQLRFNEQRIEVFRASLAQLVASAESAFTELLQDNALLNSAVEASLEALNSMIEKHHKWN